MMLSEIVFKIRGCVVVLGVMTGCGGATSTPPTDVGDGGAGDVSETPDGSGAGADGSSGVPDDVNAADGDAPKPPADVNAADVDASKSPETGSDTSTPPDGGDAGPVGEPLEAAVCDGLCVLSFASSGDWAAYDDDPAINVKANYLGSAQRICLNPAAPPNCPPGALLYGFSGAAWSFSISSIPGAYWIWGPGVTATDVADLRRFFFVKRFALGVQPSGWLSIGADDAAEVRVNGHSVGTIGSVTDVRIAAMANTNLTTFDLTPQLVAGVNTITIAVQNGSPSFAGCLGSCTYMSNPAGAVFGGSLTHH